MLSCTQLASLVGFLSKLEGIPNYYFPELKIFWGFAVAGRLPIWKDPGPVSGPKSRILPWDVGCAHSSRHWLDSSQNWRAFQTNIFLSSKKIGVRFHVAGRLPIWKDPGRSPAPNQGYCGWDFGYSQWLTWLPYRSGIVIYTKYIIRKTFLLVERWCLASPCTRKHDQRSRDHDSDEVDLENQKQSDHRGVQRWSGG